MKTNAESPSTSSPQAGWKSYASAAAALMALPATSDAVLVNIAPTNFAIAGTGSSFTNFDFDGGGSDLVFFIRNDTGIGQYGYVGMLFSGIGQAVSQTFSGTGSFTMVNNLGTFTGAGWSETSSSNLARDATMTFGFNTSEGNMGWISVRLNTGTVGGFTNGFESLEILAGAFDDTAAPVHVGTSAIPEPSSLALLATGALGITALRRRKKKATEADR